MLALIVSTVVILVLMTFVGKFLYTYVKTLNALKNIPRVDGFRFFFGHTLILKRDSVEFYKQILDFYHELRHEPVFCFWTGPRPMIVCNHPSMVETVLGSNEITTKSSLYNILHKWIGLGLLTSNGARWQTKRKLLTPSFHFSILQSYISIMNEHAKELVDAFQSNISSLSITDEKPIIDVHPLIVSASLDVICETAMGYNLNSLTSDDQEYANAIKRMTDIIMQRTKFPHLFFDFTFNRTELGREHNKLLKIIHGFTSRVIKERWLEMKEADILDNVNLGEMSSKKKKWKLAFLDLLLHEQHVNRTLTDSDIQEEVDTFMFEGHDTTAVAMTWCLFNIGRNPRVQAKVHEELDEVFPSRDCDVTSEHIGRLHYLDKVLKETLRLYPSVPFYARELSQEFTLGKHRLPAGSTIMVAPIGLHRNPLFFQDPEEFLPERFDESTRHPYAYVPFSAGPRNCIGAKFAQMEMKIMISWFMRRYEIKSLQSVEECDPAGDIILKPSKGVLLEVMERI